MNPILHYPVANPPYRRANQFILPGRLSQPGMYEPGSVQQSSVWDDFASPIAASGVDLLKARTSSGHGWRQHPSWAGVFAFTDKSRVRHHSGSIAAYIVACEPVSDSIVSARLFWSDSWTGSYQIGVIARANLDADTFYHCYYNAAASSIIVTRRVAGSAVTLIQYGIEGTVTTAFFAGNKGGYCDIAMVLVGPSIKLYVDGIERGSVVDTSIPCGLPGLYGFTVATDTTGVHLEQFSARRIANPVVGSAGDDLTDSGGANPTPFGGIRGVRSNGATIGVTPIANNTGVGRGGPFRYQWFRSDSASELPNSRTMLSGQTTALLNDHSARPGTAYFYRCAATDARGNTNITARHRITTLNATDKRVIFHGNSLTYGTGVTRESTDYPTVCAAGLGSPWIGTNIGLPSWSDIDLLNKVMPRFAPHLFDPALAKNVAVYWEGTNSLLTVSGAVAAPRTLASCAYLKALGYKVVVCNVIDRQQAAVPADMATRISDYNTALLAGYSTVADTHVDLHALLPDSTNVTNFQADKVHLTAAGYAIVAGAVQTAVAAL